MGTARGPCRLGGEPRCRSLGVEANRHRYLEKIRVFKAGVSRPDTLAWNNEIGRRGSILLVSRVAVMINRDSWGHLYCVARGEILGFTQDKLLRKHLPRMFSLIKNEG